MTEHWGLEVPNLLISVTGGAKDFNMKPRLKSVFRRGLVKVAQTTGAGGGRSNTVVQRTWHELQGMVGALCGEDLEQVWGVPIRLCVPQVPGSSPVAPTRA